MRVRDLKHLYKQSRFRKKRKEPIDSFPIRQSLSVYNLRTLSRFEQALQVIPKGSQKGTVSYIAMKQIQAIYREEGKLKDLTSNERLEQRQAIIKPLVDALFMYLKQNQANVSGSCKLQDAFK